MILADFLIPGPVICIRIREAKMKRIHTNTDPEPKHHYHFVINGTLVNNNSKYCFFYSIILRP